MLCARLLSSRDVVKLQKGNYMDEFPKSRDAVLYHLEQLKIRVTGVGFYGIPPMGSEMATILHRAVELIDALQKAKATNPTSQQPR